MAAMQARVAAATEAKLKESAEAEAAQLAESGMSAEEIAAQQAEEEARRDAAAAAAAAREAEEVARRAAEAAAAAEAKGAVQAALEAQRAAEQADAALAAEKVAEEEAIEAEVRRIRARSMAETFKGADRVQATMAHVERQASATKLRRQSMRPAFQRRMSAVSREGSQGGGSLQDAVAALRADTVEGHESGDESEDTGSQTSSTGPSSSGGAPPPPTAGAQAAARASVGGPPPGGPSPGGPPPGGPPPHIPPPSGAVPMSKRADSLPNRPPPKFNPRGLTPNMAPPPPRPGVGVILSYTDLRTRNASRQLAGLQVASLEVHLSRADFKRVFEMSADEFSGLPAWSRVALRKKSKLHVAQ